MDMFDICLRMKNQPVQRRIRPRRDLSDIPRKAIWTCGANLFAIPRNISAIRIARRHGAASSIEILNMSPVNASAVFQKGFPSWKKRGLIIWSTEDCPQCGVEVEGCAAAQGQLRKEFQQDGVAEVEEGAAHGG